jgi:hypothetical protein
MAGLKVHHFYAKEAYYNIKLRNFVARFDLSHSFLISY